MMRRNFIASGAAAALGLSSSARAAETRPSTQSGIETARAWRNLSGSEEAQHVKVLPLRMRRLVAAAGLAALGDDLTLADVLQRALAEKAAEPLELREAIIQAMPYAGLPAARRAEVVFERVMQEAGRSLPSSAPEPEGGRFQAGLAIQKSIFGDAIDAMHAGAKPDERMLVVDMLTSFCFADGYARPGLSTAERELLTFAVISAMGGCEPQVKAHAAGNIAVGNTRAMLLDVLVVLVPIIGFPKTLNALAMLNEAAPAA